MTENVTSVIHLTISPACIKMGTSAKAAKSQYQEVVAEKIEQEKVK